MKFRSRLVVAATGAVAVSIVLGSVGAYFICRHSLVETLDNTLHTQAEALFESHTLVPADTVLGESVRIVPAGASLHSADFLPLNSAVLAVADGHSPGFFTSVTVAKIPYRELVIPIPAGDPNPVLLPEGGALQIAVPLTSLQHQLVHIVWLLFVVALGGIGLAAVLGWLVARTALVPLDELTVSIEEVAASADVSRRLEPGFPDELGVLRQAFNRLLAALESSLGIQHQLVLDASHELRTPLTSLRTNLEVLRRVDELGPGERDVLVDDVLTQLVELTTLVGDLAELSRSGTTRSVPQPVQLDELVEESVALASSHGRIRHVTIDYRRTPNWVRAQPERLSRAIGNLLDNAVKWSPDGGQVEVSCSAGVVTVRDHGPGIAESDLPFVFDRFYRAAAARPLPGSGLGLSIVAQVVAEAGGTVTAHQAAGGGALLRIALPEISAPDRESSGFLNVP